MGCDIHVFLEFREDESLPWRPDHHHAALSEERDWLEIRECAAVSRNYELFGALAGIRGYGEGCRYAHCAYGLPDDCSALLQDAAKNRDWHSHSWLSLEAFKDVVGQFDYYNVVNLPKPGIAFFNYWDYTWSEEESIKTGKPLMPPNYTSIISYAEDELEKLRLDALLLNQKWVPQCRVIFWFDN